MSWILDKLHFILSYILTIVGISLFVVSLLGLAVLAPFLLLLWGVYSGGVELINRND